MAKTDSLGPHKQIVAKNDAYTGILTISLIALVVGCGLIFLDYQRYDFQRTPPRPTRYSAPAEEPPQNPGNNQPDPNNPPPQGQVQ